MKITLLSTFFPPFVVGGAEVNAYLLAGFLAKQGHDVEVLTGAKLIPRVGSFKVIYSAHLAPDPSLFWEGFWAKKTALRVRSLIRKDRIYHSFDLLAHLLVAELDLPKTIATIQDVALSCRAMTGLMKGDLICQNCSWQDLFSHRSIQERSLSPTFIGHLIRYLTAFPHRKKVIDSFKAVTTLTYFLKDHLKLDQAIVIPDLLMPVRINQNKTESSREPTILIIGRLGYDKGTDLILNALGQLNFRAVFVGNGQISYWQKQASKLAVDHKVKFVGPVPFNDTIDWYNQADLVVLASRLPEASSRTVLEAMSLGKAVIAPAFGGPAEIITDGRNGFLFERANLSALIHTIASAYQHRYQVSQTARESIKKYLPESVGPKYLELYQSIN